MDIAVLGPLVVAGSGTFNRRDRVVLETLAARHGQAVSADQLGDALWGEAPPPSAAKNLQGCVVRLRKALGRDAIETMAQGYRLAVSSEDLDIRRFERLVGRARQLLTLGEADRAAYQAATALALWRGEPFPDLDAWGPVTTERARLEELRLDAEELQVDALLQAGRHREVLADAQSMVRSAPLREQRWLLLARAQYQAGQQGEALRTLHQLRTLLVQQLGIDPAPEVAELETAILRQDLPDTVARLGIPRPTCPYQGLLAYDVDDADRYFGREGDVTACFEILSRTPLLALVGPSGSGKSSLLNAGITAGLRRRGLRTVRITPGGHPGQSLSVLAHVRPETVLAVDQAEELFTLGHDPVERQEFVDALVAQTASRSVVLALRADRLADLAAYPALSRLVEQGLHLVGGLDEQGLRDAVEVPARQAGLLVEPGLGDLLVREVRDDPGALPLLSHALLETWKRREGNTLTVAGYRDSGGIQGAVAQSAERLYAQLDQDQRLLLRDLVLRLMSPGLQGEPVRSRVPRRLVAPDGERASLIERLVAARLVTSDEGVLEITHEALARAWPRLRGWLDDDIEGQRMLHHLAGAADAWDSLGRPDSELYRGIRLARALDWHARTRSAITDTEGEFLEASRVTAEAERRSAEQQARLRERMIRRLRGALSGAALLLVLALVAGALAWQQQRAAQENAASAAEAASLAVARRAGANAQVTEDIDESLLLAAAGVAIHDSTDTRFNVLAAVQRFPQLFRTTPLPGDESIAAVSAHPGGDTVAVLDAASTLRLLDAGSGAVLATEQIGPARTPQIMDYQPPLEFSPDGELLAVAASPFSGPAVRVLDARTLQPLDPQPRGLPPAGHMATAVAFDPGGRYLVAVVQHFLPRSGISTGSGSLALVWDLRSVGAPRQVTLPGDAQQSATLGARPGVLFTGPPLLRHDLAAGTSTRLPTVRAGDLTLSPDRRLIAATDGFRPLLLDARTGQVARRIGAAAEGAAVRFSPDGRQLAAVGVGNRRLTLWDLTRRGPEVAQQFLLGRGPAEAVAFSADGSFLYAADGADALRHWDLTGTRRLLAREPVPPSRQGLFAVVAPGGGRAVFLGEEGFSLQDIASGRATRWFPVGDRYRHTYGTWHPDGRHFVSAIGGVLTVRDIDTGRVVDRRRLAEDEITEIDYNPDASRLVVSERSGRVFMLDGATLEPVGVPVDVGEPVSFVQAGPDDHTAVVLIGGPAEDRFWREDSTEWAMVDLAEGTVTRRGSAGLAAATWLAYSPDGRHFAIGGGDDAEELGPTGSEGELVVVDARTGEWVQPPTAGHTGVVYAVAYSPDGTRILTSALDGTVGLWDALTGRLLARVAVEGRPFVSAEFLPDGTAVRIVEWHSGLAHTWDLDTDRALGLACDMAGRNLTEDEWRVHFGDRPYERACPA